MKYAIKSFFLLIKKYPYDIFIQIVNIATSVVLTVIPIYIISRIILTFQSESSYETVLLEILWICIALVICHIISIVTTYYNAFIERNFKVHLSIMFYRKLDFIDYDFHESPKFLNDYTRALEEGTERIYRSAKAVTNVIRIIFQSLSVFAIIFSMHYLAVVYAIGIGIIYMILRLRVAKLDFKALTLQRPFFRQRQYVNRTFFIKDAMADLKTTQIEEILLENSEKANDEIIKVIDKVTLEKTFISYIGDILISSIYPVTLGVLAYVTIEEVELASFAALTVAATTLSTLVTQFVSAMGEMQTHAIECKIPFELIEMKSNIEGIILNDIKDDFYHLTLKEVTFSYDDTHDVLKNVSMEIKKGEKIAIVGANGAGKTTLVKLLLRLYDTKSGDIFINGQHYKDTTAKELRKMVGAVFQNVEVYAASIAENILLKHLKTEEDYQLVDEALRFSGLYDYVHSLEQGVDTQVTREFNRQGAIFSGGQMQRIAIARGYAQNYQLFILDEPSSSLDPLAEAQVYQNMLKMGKDKTIIFISHRLTTTVNADQIYLFENGEVLEHGTHQELMAFNGQYRQMFSSQSSKYLGGQYENDTK